MKKQDRITLWLQKEEKLDVPDASLGVLLDTLCAVWHQERTQIGHLGRAVRPVDCSIATQRDCSWLQPLPLEEDPKP